MSESEDKRDDFGSKLENIWDKVSKGVEEGLKVGKEEIVRTAKIGKIRLDIASLKSNKKEKIKLLGEKTHELLQNEEIKVPQLDELLEEIKGIDAQIDAQEEEIQAIMEEKSVSAQKEEETVAEGAEVVEAEVVSPAEEEKAAEPKPVKKRRTRKKKVDSASTDELPKDTGAQDSTEDKEDKSEE